jgi:hypothetical protein
MSPSTKHAAIAMTLVTSLAACKYLVQSSWISKTEPLSFSQDIADEGNPWQQDVELIHAADQYDSLESATKQVAAQLAEFIHDHQWQFKSPILVQVRFEGVSSPSDFPERTVATLEQYLPLVLDAGSRLQFKLLSSTVPLEQPEPNKSKPVELRLTTLPIRSIEEPNLGTGILVMSGSIFFGDQSKFLGPLQIASKGWIEHWSSFRASPSNQHFRQYRAESVDRAQSLIARELANQWHGQRTNYRLVGGMSPNQAADIVRRQLPSLDLIVDQFEQTFQLMVQDGSQLPAFTRSALLVDQSPQKLEAVRVLLDSSAKLHSEQLWSRLRWLCSLALVLVVLTFGLDQITLGYYTWRIRGGAVLVASIILLLLA